MDLRPGDIVYGANELEQHEIVRFLGNGSFGLVYEVRDQSGTSFALKTIVTAFVDRDNLASLINEGRLASEIQHPNVIRILFFHDGTQYPNLPPYMLMEYANEGNLDALLSTRRPQQFYSNDELRALFFQLASGMKAINEKLVHRDIKPDNILIQNGLLKISDFGLSKVVDAATRSQTFKGMNHIRYCAPEAWRMENNLPEMDMYSMGIVFYEIAALRHPYDVQETWDVFQAWRQAHLLHVAPDPRNYDPSLELGLSQLILKMMAKRPEDRYQSWDQVIERLEAAPSPRENVPNVSGLVERAMESQRQAEAARLAAEARARVQMEQEDLLAFSVEEIVRAAKEIVETFNKASDFIKLEVRTSNRFAFSIIRKDKPQSAIQVEIVRTTDAPRLDNQTISGWGKAKAPSGRGFNLLLVTKDQSDLYGRWETLHVRHNVIARRSDNRPEPFPFELRELPREIPLLRAMHIYTSEHKAFSSELLNPLIEELL